MISTFVEKQNINKYIQYNMIENIIWQMLKTESVLNKI